MKNRCLRYTVLAITIIGMMCSTPRDTYASTVESGTVLTSDNISVSFKHFKAGRPEVILITHGFYNNKDTVLFNDIAERFFQHFDVISFDLRGHGESSGLFSWTSFEERDLRAVVDYATGCGYEKIGVIGFSLGAAVTVIEGSINHTIDSMIAVSAPADFWQIDYHFWEKEMIEDFLLNLGDKGKGKKIRPGNPFMDKTPPLNVIENIAPRPILLIHGEKDWLINPHHSKTLFEKAREPKKIIIMDEAGHAEKIFDSAPDEFMSHCVEWFKQTLSS
jgi:uncharacterized protein